MTDNLSPAKIRERADRPTTLVAFSSEEARTIATAIEFADDAAIAHLEGETFNRNHGWRHSAYVNEPESLTRTLQYLTDRGLLERHPSEPWVRIREASA